jgi:hypothetical protein
MVGGQESGRGAEGGEIALPNSVTDGGCHTLKRNRRGPGGPRYSRPGGQRYSFIPPRVGFAGGRLLQSRPECEHFCIL